MSDKQIKCGECSGEGLTREQCIDWLYSNTRVITDEDVAMYDAILARLRNLPTGKCEQQIRKQCAVCGCEWFSGVHCPRCERPDCQPIR